MPIKVACKCGQTFAVKDEMAGKTLKCPKCQQPLPIPAGGNPAAGNPAGGNPGARAAPAPPAAGSLAGLFDDAGFKVHHGPRCPQCGEALRTADAVLCTACGFNLQSGQKIEGAKVFKQGERGHAEAAESLLTRAQTQIELDKLDAKKATSSGMPAWVIFLALSGLAGFVATMFLIPRDKAFLYTGYCIAGFGGLMSTYFNIRMTVAAFLESTKCGLLYMFVPFYALYYLITRWDRMGGFFLMSVVYSVAIGFGLIMMLLSPMLKKEENDQQGWRIELREDVPENVQVVSATSSSFRSCI